MLELKNINSFYGDAHILFNVGMRVEPAQAVGLFGRNGAGKTTLFRSVMGLTPPSCVGEILFKDKNINGLAPFDIANRGIGFVPEDRRIFPNLTVRQNLIVGRKKSDAQKKRWDLDEAYHYFPRLREMEKNLGCEMSGGEQQMLTVARTMMGNPELLLLDEPTEGLAPIIASNLIEMVIRIKAQHNISMLVVEQFSPHILDFLDKCYVIEMGHLIYEGDPKELKADEDLQRKLLGVGIGDETEVSHSGGRRPNR